jgi:hypothetical protein
MSGRLRTLWSRCVATLKSEQSDREFDDEMREHLRLLIEEHEARGLSRDEARRAAIVALGPPQALREINCESRGAADV